MFDSMLLLAQGSFFPWYNWVLLALIVGLLIFYKMWKSRMQ